MSYLNWGEPSIRTPIVINSNQIKATRQEKRLVLAKSKGFLFYYNIVRLHTTMLILQKLNELVWEVSSYLSYSPNLDASDY